MKSFFTINDYNNFIFERADYINFYFCLASCYDEGGKGSCEFRKKNGLNFCNGRWGKLKCRETCQHCVKTTPNSNNTTKVTFIPYPKASCGAKNIKSARIINGQNAQPGEWPWIASLQESNNTICGGTLVSPKWVSSVKFISKKSIWFSFV